jgi:hypothetical protein
VSLSISGKALLREHERLIERLKLEELLPSTPEPALPCGINEIREAIGTLVERHPDQRGAIAGALQSILLKLAYTR